MPTASKTPEQLIQECQNLVRSLARQIHRRAPAFVECDDLVAYGQVGLAEAAREFDPSKDVRFSTYAFYRIRGAIYDGLYQICGLHRRRTRALQFDRLSNAALSEEAGPPPETDDDLRSQAGWFGRVTGTLAMIYLATQRGGHDDDRTLEPADTAARSPLAIAAERDLAERLGTLIDQLSDESACLIRAIYFEGITLQEAGQRLGISKSWASRLHARALDQLARWFRESGTED